MTSTVSAGAPSATLFVEAAGLGMDGACAATAIKGATSSTYSPKAADYTYGILVRAIVSKSGFESLTLYSAVRDYSLRIDPAMPLEFINDDECLEITPKNIRVRKVHLDENMRKRAKAAA